MKRILPAFLLSLILFVQSAFAGGPPDEGMWLPLLLKDYNYAEMQRLGLKLTPEQIYDVNHSSLKDAVVQLGGFCTAEIISKEGLLLTNHHCGYDAIASSSSEEHNYLRDGFWAASHEQEIPIEGLYVKFLVKMIDVTERVLNKGKGMDESTRLMAEAEEEMAIEAELSEDGKYEVDVEQMFDGNARYAFVYQLYHDIRLVGAPPSSIGKFGGDTDNWMWPRHTGDFSLLRIYASPDNQPANYDPANVPFIPRHSLPVSMKGLKEGDFTMIMGYPASTTRYLTSSEVKTTKEVEAPLMIDIIGKRLKIMKAEMDKDEGVRIQLASEYASLANTHKYYQGQLRGLNKFDFITDQQKAEKELQSWIDADPDRKQTYGDVLGEIAEVQEEFKSTVKDNLNMNLAGFSPSFIGLGISAWRLHRTLENESASDEEIDARLANLSEQGAELFPAYLPSMEAEILKLALDVMKNNMSEQAQMDLFSDPLYLKKAKGSNERYVQMIMSKSILTDEARLSKFLAKPSAKKLNNDPGVKYVLSLIKLFQTGISPWAGAMNLRMESARQLYMKALMEKENRNFYPDADFTMRLTYGTVQPYNSWEGKAYNTFTYANEILGKYKAGDEEFDVPEKLRTLISNKDFGQYGNADGTMNVCFLHNTDITGGNSGSPVINGNGELVGCAFDGNWESMTSDLFWQDEYVRTISVDVRYVLFIIDKFAGAGHLIEEMELVK